MENTLENFIMIYFMLLKLFYVVVGAIPYKFHV